MFVRVVEHSDNGDGKLLFSALVIAIQRRGFGVHVVARLSSRLRRQRLFH